MNRNYKSLDYLKEIKYNMSIDNAGLADLLDTIGYILQDNGLDSARSFLDDLSEDVYDGNIKEIEED